jgi:hypothetical protein
VEASRTNKVEKMFDTDDGLSMSRYLVSKAVFELVNARNSDPRQSLLVGSTVTVNEEKFP